METECVIKFDNNPQCVFYGGQTLAGSVELTTRKEKIIRAIHITLEGYASVHWRESRYRSAFGNSKVSYLEHFRAHDQYLKSRTYVLGGEESDSFELAPGKYSYTFQVALPNQLPSSLETEHGHIRYQVVVTLERSLRFDVIFKKPFTVLYALDLNRSPQYKRPLRCEEVTTLGCLFCKSGALTGKLCIPFSGYAPGQSIPFEFCVENESTVDFSNIFLKLEQEITFISDTPQRQIRKKTRKISEARLERVLKFSNKKYKGVLKLPSIPPTSLKSCRIINTYYFLMVNIQSTGCHSDFELVVPISIGSLPLYETLTDTVNVISCQPASSAGEIFYQNERSLTDYCPPSYEEATNGGKLFIPEDEDGRSQTEAYIPKYPVYYNFVTLPPEETQIQKKS